MNVKHKCYAAAGRQAMGRRPWHFTTPPTKIMQTQYMTAVFMGWLINILWRRVLCAVCTFDDLANARARALTVKRRIVRSTYQRLQFRQCQCSGAFAHKFGFVI